MYKLPDSQLSFRGRVWYHVHELDGTSRSISIQAVQASSVEEARFASPLAKRTGATCQPQPLNALGLFLAEGTTHTSIVELTRWFYDLFSSFLTPHLVD